MGRLTSGLTVFVLVVAFSAYPQSLAEIAKKERERRALLEEESPVIGDEELAKGEGATLSVMGTRSPTPDRFDRPAGNDPEATSDRKQEPPLTEKEIRDLRQRWYLRWQEQMALAREQLDQARDDVYQCRSAESFFFVPLAVDCDGVQERLAEAEANLKEVQANRYNWELLLPR